MKAITKRIVFGLLALALMLSMVACGGTKDDTTATTTAGGDDVVTTVGGDDPDVTTTVGGDQPSGSGSVNVTTTKKPQGNTQSLSWAQVKAKMPANLRNTKIVFYNWNEVRSITDAEKVIRNFTKETGITVDWQLGSYADYATEIAAKQAAKNAPDIIRMRVADPTTMAMLQPLSKTGYDFSDAAWDQQVLKQYTYKGNAYAVNMQNTLMQLPNVLLYNKALVTRYDLEDPYALWKKGKWTWNKFVEVMTDFKEAADENYKAFNPAHFQVAAQLVGSDFVRYTENGYVNNMTDSKLAQGIQKYIKIRDAGLTTGGTFMLEPFESGKILFFNDSIIGARKTHFYFTDLKSKGQLSVVPMPQMDGEKNYYQLYKELEAYAIPVGAKNAAAVPYFLRYWLDAENYDENNFFATKTILEVYKSCRAQQNIFNAENWHLVMPFGSAAQPLTDSIFKATAAQVAPMLSQYRSVVEALVKQANNKLDTAQK